LFRNWKKERFLGENLSLSLKRYAAPSSCRKELEQAEGKVEILRRKNGKLQAETV